jgi:hypothetical protein
MHIEKITYSGVMPIASYGVNDRMDVSVVIKEGEDSKQAAHFADQFITEFFKEKYPTLKRPTGITANYSNPISEMKEYNNLDTTKLTEIIGKNETPIESFKRQVDQCKSLNELNAWNLFASGKGKEEYKKYLETAKLKYK